MRIAMKIFYGFIGLALLSTVTKKDMTFHEYVTFLISITLISFQI